MRHHAIEVGGFGNMPRSVRRQGPLRKSESTGPTANQPPPALYAARDRKLIGMLTGGGGGVIRVAPRPEFWRKIAKKSVKTSFFEVMSEVQKDSEDFSSGIGIFFKIKLLNKFSCNLRSKSARSTLTSPGPIRVKKSFVTFFLYQWVVLENHTYCSTK